MKTYQRSQLTGYAQAIYAQLMTWALADKVQQSSDGKRIGEPNPYRAAKPNKAVAACVDWRWTKPEGALAHGWWISFGKATVDDAVQGALAGCRRFEERRCQCVLVDENDRNALALPAFFVQKHFR